jgi:hypothetical protein
MRPLSNSSCLQVWERGRRLHSLDRGLLALSFALPQAESVPEAEAVADWPLGRRNQALLQLICLSFGSRLNAWAACDHCGEKLELALDATDFLATASDEPAPPVITVRERTFRLPSSRDLAQIIRANDPETAALRLIEQCQLEPADSQPLTLEAVDEIEEAMAAADPLAEIRLALSCPACSHAWDEPLDVASFLWAEIETRARLLLWQVHILASAYGWSEPEILALTEARRTLYLEMVQGASEQPTLSPQTLPASIPHTMPDALYDFGSSLLG